MAEALTVTPSLAIPLAEVELRSSPSGGPGGQHANRSHTRVEVRFDVEASAVLSSRQRGRLFEKLGPVVRAQADDGRSQARNRALALDRLAERLAVALRPERRRVATRPTKGSQRRRVEHKRRRSDLKATRTRPRPADWLRISRMGVRVPPSALEKSRSQVCRLAGLNFSRRSGTPLALPTA